MRVGVFLDAFADRDLESALDWVVEHLPGVRDVELGCGGYSPATHVDVEAASRSDAEPARIRSAVDERGLRIAALNVSGNPLHPDPAIGAVHDRQLRAAVRVAAALGVDRVVAMSGCPGASPQDAAPHFCGGGWLPDLEGIWERQWADAVAPYWTDVLEFAASEHPALRICLELHPGTWAYNAVTFERMASLGEAIAINLDPSHFFWQGIDPMAVLARFPGRVAFAHGKDTTVLAANAAVNGMLDPRWPGVAGEMPWNFSTVGHGHDRAWWTDFVVGLRTAGHDGVISIEFEDPFVDAGESVVESARVLEAAIAAAAHDLPRSPA